MRKVIMKDIKGSQGSWEAEVPYDDGTKEKLACLHKYFTHPWPQYHDPWTGVGRDTKFANHVALIRDKRRVILTDDDINESKGRGEGFFQRKPKPHGYLGVCEIKDFVFDDTGMHLVFADRLPEA